VSGPEVQLASSSDLTPEQLFVSCAGWSWELKLDGIRAVVDKRSDGSIRIWNRRERDITIRYPDVVATMAAMDWVGVVDGEIIVVGADGKPDFSAVHRRDAQSRPATIGSLAVSAPATFMPFDVLEYAKEDGRLSDVRALPYTLRREVLEGMFTSLLPISEDGPAMWAFVQAEGLEGLIAKDPNASYRPGRQKSWIKLKDTKRISALVTGWSEAQGSRQELGALQLSLWDPEGRELVPIGAVGSGFSARDLRQVKQLVQAGPLVVEVEYLGVTPEGKLRMPVFKGVRNDVDPATCTDRTLFADL
jgi:bifunctional non-homologous end joining protein LigD